MAEKAGLAHGDALHQRQPFTLAGRGVDHQIVIAGVVADADLMHAQGQAGGELSIGEQAQVGGISCGPANA